MIGTADTFERLAAVILERRAAPPESSYVARLVGKGEDQVLKKIGEEATELVMACKDADRARIVAECADLWFHSMIALSLHGLGPAEVAAELARRAGTSGLEEAARRKQIGRALDEGGEKPG
jgi:phosphoribosyl-ATP pyrophosphohydrolase